MFSGSIHAFGLVLSLQQDECTIEMVMIKYGYEKAAFVRQFWILHWKSCDLSEKTGKDQVLVTSWSIVQALYWARCCNIAINPSFKATGKQSQPDFEAPL